MLKMTVALTIKLIVKLSNNYDIYRIIICHAQQISILYSISCLVYRATGLINWNPIASLSKWDPTEEYRLTPIVKLNVLLKIKNFPIIIVEILTKKLAIVIILFYIFFHSKCHSCIFKVLKSINYFFRSSLIYCIQQDSSERSRLLKGFCESCSFNFTFQNKPVLYASCLLQEQLHEAIKTIIINSSVPETCPHSSTQARYFLIQQAGWFSPG